MNNEELKKELYDAMTGMGDSVENLCHVVRRQAVAFLKWADAHDITYLESTGRWATNEGNSYNDKQIYFVFQKDIWEQTKKK